MSFSCLKIVALNSKTEILFWKNPNNNKRKLEEKREVFIYFIGKIESFSEEQSPNVCFVWPFISRYVNIV